MYLTKFTEELAFCATRNEKRKSFRMVYETINSIDIAKSYTKNFKWFKKLKSSLKFVYDRSPKWALNYQESTLPDLGNLTKDDFN